MDIDYRWYAIFVVQGKEFHVKDKLDAVAVKIGSIREVLLPTFKKISEVRRKKVVSNVPVYPSYIFVYTTLDNTVAAAIRETTYVLNLLTDNGKPTPISEEEMDIVKTIAANNEIQSAFKYKIGDMVEILGGHCRGLSGRVITINSVNKLEVEIPLFNRSIYTQVKLEDVRKA